MLSTPLGVIRICIDGICTDYEESRIFFDRPPCREKPIAGCYRIEVNAKGRRCIACTVEPTGVGIHNTGDSGENYINAEFIKDNMILTIGVESDNLAFESVRLPFGLQCNLNDKVDKIVFGVAWATDYDGEGDVRTWFAADPTI